MVADKLTTWGILVKYPNDAFSNRINEFTDNSINSFVSELVQIKKIIVNPGDSSLRNITILKRGSLGIGYSKVVELNGVKAWDVKPLPNLIKSFGDKDKLMGKFFLIDRTTIGFLSGKDKKIKELIAKNDLLSNEKLNFEIKIQDLKNKQIDTLRQIATYNLKRKEESSITKTKLIKDGKK